MKKVFQIWLLIFVAGAFFLTFAISWWIHSALAKQSARELLNIKLDDARRRVDQTQANLEAITDMSKATALAKVRAFANLVAENPALLKDPGKLEHIKNFLDVDELHVSDDKGKLIATFPQKYLGFEMAKSEQSRPFMEAITNKNFELVQDPRLNGAKMSIQQYAGVARIDQPGIVQIGYSEERILEATRLADVENIAHDFRIGHQGGIRIRKIEEGESVSDQCFKEVVEGMPSFCMRTTCGDYVITGNLPEEEMYLSRNSVLQILVIANLILFGIIFFLVSILLQKVVIKGIYSVNDSLEEITNGNLDEKISVNTTSEFSALSTGINQTVSALKKSIENEAKRLDAELEMGRTIQNSVLPADFPEHPRFQLAAGMFTAKEVGGDFYDFFMMDEDHLAMVIADVSGKGITAALFMMNSKALIKELLLANHSPALAVAQANRELCAHNDAHMFLTAFVAVFNLKENTLTCVNAGHNPPLIKHGQAPWDYLKIKHSLVLGVMEKAPYKEIDILLEPGDQLFLYTDGVTEAQNNQAELYGEARLAEDLNNLTETPADTIQNIRIKLQEFADGAQQSDDITMLMLKSKETPDGKHP